MTYATEQDMIDRFGEEELALVTDRVNGTLVNYGLLNVALADADATINSYIQTRYTVPLTPVPRVLVAAATKLARYQLHDDGASDQITKDRNDVIAWLKDVSRGAARLGDDDTATSDPASASSSPQIINASRPSIEDGLDGY